MTLSQVLIHLRHDGSFDLHHIGVHLLDGDDLVGMKHDNRPMDELPELEAWLQQQGYTRTPEAMGMVWWSKIEDETKLAAGETR
jgi:hypothetical protein